MREYQRAARPAQKGQSKTPSSSLCQTSLNRIKTHPHLKLQRTIGNQAVLHMLHSRNMQTDTTAQTFVEPRFSHDFSQIPIHSTQTAVPQTKLRVNQPGDVYEREADQVAEQVMRMAGPETSVSDDEDEAKSSLMRQQSNKPGTNAATEAPVVPPVVHSVPNSGGGQPLDTTTRAFMEPRFGHDFSKVRVHSGAEANAAAKAVDALAYTIGPDIVFGAEQYAPSTAAGRKLLAHELTHTIQQGFHKGHFPVSVDVASPESREEQEADAAARSIGEGRDFAARIATPLQVARKTSIDQNKERIAAIRQEAKNNDAEALARMFEDTYIVDDGTVQGRLRAILNATEKSFIPGLQTGIDFSDEGFKGDRSPGGAGFRDPHPSSRNQVGHFLTAVGLSFNPAKVEEIFMGRRLRDWLEAPKSMSQEEVALRLIIGHELAPDPSITDAMVGAAIGSIGTGPTGAAVGAASAMLNGFKRQFKQATDQDVLAFRQANVALGTAQTIDMSAAETALKPIKEKINPKLRGNSVQDLRLSLAGWNLGQLISAGKFATGGDVAKWVRLNLKQ